MARDFNSSSLGAPPGAIRGAAAARWLCIAAATLGLVGCGGDNQPTYRAGGKVAFPDGTPLPGGWVSFRSLDSGKKVSARGSIQPDGTFELTTYKPSDGAVEGRHHAIVAPVIHFQKGESAPGNGQPPAPPIDPKFSNFEASGLEFTVTDDPQQNQYEIVVTPPPAAR